MTISVQYVNEEGRHFRYYIATMGNVKFARFKVGTMTIEISSAQDVNSDNPPTMPNTRQNTATTNMVSGAGSSLPGVHEPSLQLDGQNNSTSSSQSNEPIQRIETPQIAGSIHGSEPLQVTGSIHGPETTQITGSIHGKEITQITGIINRTESPQITGLIHGTETPETTVSIHGTENLQGTVSTRTGTEEVKNQEDDFIQRMSGWLMTVATILMGMAFQSGMNIPGGYWSETKINSSSASIDSSNDTRHTAGQPIILNVDHYRYIAFLILNISAFGTSMVVIILLLFKKYPRHRLLSIRWLLVYAMGIIAAVYALGCAPKFLYALYISAALVTLMVLVYFLWLIFLVAKLLVNVASLIWEIMRFM